MAKLSQLAVHLDKIADGRLCCGRMYPGFVQSLVEFLIGNIYSLSKNFVSENNPERNNADVISLN